MNTPIEPRTAALHEPTSAELDAIYLLGRDAWGEGMSEAAWLTECRRSVKYRRGTWHATTEGGRIVSALIVYADGFDLVEGCHGIGSVATARESRGRGHASRLLDDVLGELERRGSRGVFLFQDVATSLYVRYGFEALGRGGESACLWRPFEPGGPMPHAPTYF